MNDVVLVAIIGAVATITSALLVAATSLALRLLTPAPKPEDQLGDLRKELDGIVSRIDRGEYIDYERAVKVESEIRQIQATLEQLRPNV